MQHYSALDMHLITIGTLFGGLDQAGAAADSLSIVRRIIGGLGRFGRFSRFNRLDRVTGLITHHRYRYLPDRHRRSELYGRYAVRLG